LDIYSYIRKDSNRVIGDMGLIALIILIILLAFVLGLGVNHFFFVILLLLLLLLFFV
jgi:hypothetical protein